jgi:hypothetical protein
MSTSNANVNCLASKVEPINSRCVQYTMSAMQSLAAPWSADLPLYHSARSAFYGIRHPSSIRAIAEFMPSSIRANTLACYRLGFYYDLASLLRDMASSHRLIRHAHGSLLFYASSYATHATGSSRMDLLGTHS